MDYGIHKEISKKDGRQKLWKKQRKKRGFDDTELWNLDMTVIEFILPRLKEFRKNTIGFPNELSGIEEWYHEIDDMIYAMKKYIKKCGHVDFSKDERSKKGFDLFFKRFFDLWW